jgi:hypothetical protein
MAAERGMPVCSTSTETFTPVRWCLPELPVVSLKAKLGISVPFASLPTQK